MDPRLKLLAVVIGLVVTGLVYKSWFARINLWAASAWKWVLGFLTDEKTCRVAATFFVEAAVLWFVFPVLDSIYDPTKRGDPALGQAYIFSAICFLCAVILSHAGKGG